MSKDFGVSTSSVLGQIAVIAASAFYAGSAVYVQVYRRHARGLEKRNPPPFSHCGHVVGDLFG
jgi:hypothetical protein